MATSDNILEHTIGNGMIFPIKLTKNKEGKTGWYPTLGDPNLIINNRNHLLTFTIGQKMRQENFGTRIWECLEEPNTQAQGFLVNQFLRDAIKEYEDRIIFKSATITRNANKLHIEMQYTLVNSTVVNTLGINYNT